MPNTIIISEEQLQAIKEWEIANKESKIAKDVLPSNKIMEKYLYVNSLLSYQILSETKSSFLTNKPEVDNWVWQLIDDLTDTIKGEIMRGNSKGFIIDSITYPLPKIPFLKEYIIDIQFSKLKNQLYIGKYTPKVSDDSILEFKLTLNYSVSRLKEIITSFVFHEFLHAYQDVKMKEKGLYQLGIDSGYNQLSNLLINLTPWEKENHLEPIIKTLTPSFEILYNILYHVSKIEQNAYVSQSIGEYISKIKSSMDYVRLSKNDKLKSLYLSKEYQSLKENLNRLKELIEQLDTNSKFVFLTLIEERLGNKFHWKNTNQMFKKLSFLIDNAYEKFCNKVGKWIDTKEIKK